MKISKLFHWLYAILMLLPFAFFVPSVFYYAFNDNASMQTIEVPKTETIAVDFNQDINLVSMSNSGGTCEKLTDYSVRINGQPSFMELQNIPLVSGHKYFVNYLSSDYYPSTELFLYFRSFTPNNYGLSNVTPSFNRVITANSDSTKLVITTYNNYQIVDYDFSLNLIDLTKMFGVGNEPTNTDFVSLFGDDFQHFVDSELMQITYDTGETEQLVENTSIINYAWESVWDLPLFSWSKVTFVSIPFAYMTSLFGIASNSTLNYVFGYFATISIVWLIFDVIMYVPMLVHRWIDKARIE